MKAINIAAIQETDLRLSAELLDRTVAGDRDGTITSGEVDRALEVVGSDPRLTTAPEVRANLEKLKAYLERYGRDAGSRPVPAYPPPNDLHNALGIQLEALGSTTKTPTLLLQDSDWESQQAQLFEVPYDQRKIRDGQSVLVPLEARALSGIEVEYQDTRKLKDLELNARQPGDYDWVPFRGDRWFQMADEEFIGSTEIKRQRDTDAPVINNPVTVKLEIVYPTGTIFKIAEPAVRFNVDDAFDSNSSGYPTTDNFDGQYGRLPDGPLPPGCMLRLTPSFANKKPWEKLRNIAVDLAWVRPTYLP